MSGRDAAPRDAAPRDADPAARATADGHAAATEDGPVVAATSDATAVDPAGSAATESGPAVAVIGAGGFLGRALCDALRAAGRPAAEFTRATPFVDDAGRPAPGLVAARTVYYLASSLNPAVAERDPDAVAADLALFDRFLDALGALPDRPYVVLPSSGGTVYDVDVAPPYGETSPVAPRGQYGAAKVAMERRLAEVSRTGSATVLRISNVYGPGQPTSGGQGVIGHWLAAAAKGEPIVLFGDPAASRDYVFVDDVVAAFLAVGPGAPPVINVGSGEPTSLGELADLVNDVTGGVEIVREADRGFDVRHTWLDVTLAREALGWTPRTSLREGLRRTWEHAPR